MTITEDLQVELRDLTMGAGQPWRLTSVSGLGIPDLRTSDSPRPIDHGEFPGLDLLEGRTIRLELRVHAASPTELRTRLDELKQAWAPADADATERSVPLTIRVVERENIAYGRPRRMSLETDDTLFDLARALVEYRATDPRLYAAAESTVSVSPPVASAGRTYDLTFDRAYGAGTSGIVTATNAGNFGTRPVWEIDGPLTNIDLENVTANKTVSIGIDLLSGETLTVDFQERTVLLGTASRYNLVTSGASDWWELAPGDNDLRLGADSGSGSATVTWRSAWL